MGVETLAGQRHRCGVLWVMTGLGCERSRVQIPGVTPIFEGVSIEWDRLETSCSVRVNNSPSFVCVFSPSFVYLCFQLNLTFSFILFQVQELKVKFPCKPLYRLYILWLVILFLTVIQNQGKYITLNFITSERGMHSVYLWFLVEKHKTKLFVQSM